jgi:hypothetical protein
MIAKYVGSVSGPSIKTVFITSGSGSPIEVYLPKGKEAVLTESLTLSTFALHEPTLQMQAPQYQREIAEPLFPRA